MMIDLVEEKEEIKIHVLLGDYLVVISICRAALSHLLQVFKPKYQFTLNDLEDEIEDIAPEGIEFLQAHRYLIQRNRGIPKDQEVLLALPALPEDW